MCAERRKAVPALARVTKNRSGQARYGIWYGSVMQSLVGDQQQRRTCSIWDAFHIQERPAPGSKFGLAVPCWCRSSRAWRSRARRRPGARRQRRPRRQGFRAAQARRWAAQTAWQCRRCQAEGAWFFRMRRSRRALAVVSGLLLGTHKDEPDLFYADSGTSR